MDGSTEQLHSIWWYFDLLEQEKCPEKMLEGKLFLQALVCIGSTDVQGLANGLWWVKIANSLWGNPWSIVSLLAVRYSLLHLSKATLRPGFLQRI